MKARKIKTPWGHIPNVSFLSHPQCSLLQMSEHSQLKENMWDNGKEIS